ncbi:MAG: 5-formyltetrahydrofolate cyclo-ligase [Syntrophobacteraceae bacterium]|nr:5-formyltetrahydrofolate cyclo-ligase [Desulfobacteraceae bacterium]
MKPEQAAKSGKDLFRERFAAEHPLVGGEWGKAAENLRRIPPYAGARTVMVSLHPALRQVCLNLLNDRKRIVLPTPGLQKGFVLLDPAAIPPSKRLPAIQMKLKDPSLVKLPYHKPMKEPVDMIVTESLAVTRDGKRMGSGEGFLDLQAAILHALGWTSPELRVVTIVQEDQLVESLPTEDTDVDIHWIVTPRQVMEAFRGVFSGGGILWENLENRAVRRNDALYYLYRRSGKGPPQPAQNIGDRPENT